MPTSSHIFYIPLLFILGLIAGVVLGRRSALVQLEEDKRQEERRARRAAAKAQREAAVAGDADATAPPAEPG